MINDKSLFRSGYNYNYNFYKLIPKYKQKRTT